jgi:hypothetical protein
VIQPPDRPRPDRGDPFGGRDWRSIANQCGQFQKYLDEWETEFIGGLQRFPRLSPKQAVKLSEDVRRLQAMGCRI